MRTKIYQIIPRNYQMMVFFFRRRRSLLSHRLFEFPLRASLREGGRARARRMSRIDPAPETIKSNRREGVS